MFIIIVCVWCAIRFVRPATHVNRVHRDYKPWGDVVRVAWQRLLLGKAYLGTTALKISHYTWHDHIL